MLRKLLCAGVIALTATTVQAGIFGSALTFNGTPDQITTQSPAGRAAFFDLDSNGILSGGDVVYGFVSAVTGRMDYTPNPGFIGIGTSPISGGGTTVDFGPSNQAAPGGATDGYTVAMFAGQLVDNGAAFLSSPANSIFNLTEVQDAGVGGLREGYRLFDLVGAGIASSFSGFADTAIAAIVSGISTDPFNAASLLDFSTTNGYQFELAAGLAGGFFQSESTFSATGNFQGFKQSAGLNVLTDAYGGATYKKVPQFVQFNPPTGITGVDVAVDATSVISNGSGIWKFQTDSSSLRLNAVPEPATILAFTGIALAGFGARRRRKGA